MICNSLNVLWMCSVVEKVQNDLCEPVKLPDNRSAVGIRLEFKKFPFNVRRRRDNSFVF